MNDIERIYSLLLHSNGLKIRAISQELELDKYYVAEIMFSSQNIPYWYQDDDSLWYAKEGALQIEESKEENDILTKTVDTPQKYNIDRFPHDNISNSLRTYLYQIQQFRLYSNDELLELFRRYKNGDRKAYELLVKSLQRFVANIALLYNKKGALLEDIIQEGNIGLVRAIERFDDTQYFSFTNYAKSWILQSISYAMSILPYLVKIPSNQLSLYRQIRRFSDKYEVQYGYPPTVSEIDLNRDVDVEQIAFLYKLPNPLTDITYAVDDLDCYESSFPSPDAGLMRESWNYYLERLLSMHTNRSADIVRMYYGLAPYKKEYSLEQIAREHNITRERVRQIKEKTIRYMREIACRRGKNTYIHTKEEQKYLLDTSYERPQIHMTSIFKDAKVEMSNDSANVQTKPKDISKGLAQSFRDNKSLPHINNEIPPQIATADKLYSQFIECYDIENFRIFLAHQGFTRNSIELYTDQLKKVFEPGILQEHKTIFLEYSNLNGYKHAINKFCYLPNYRYNIHLLASLRLYIMFAEKCMYETQNIRFREFAHFPPIRTPQKTQSKAKEIPPSNNLPSIIKTPQERFLPEYVEDESFDYINGKVILGQMLKIRSSQQIGKVLNINILNETTGERQLLLEMKKDGSLCRIKDDSSLFVVLCKKSSNTTVKESEVVNRSSKHEPYVITRVKSTEPTTKVEELKVVKNTKDENQTISSRQRVVFVPLSSIKVINGQSYRIMYSSSAFYVNKITHISSDKYNVGHLVIFSSYQSSLYKALDKNTYLQQIESIEQLQDSDKYKINVLGVWYSNTGELLEKSIIHLHNSGTKSNGRYEKRNKETITKTIQETFDLYSLGKKPEQIAEIRNLTLTSVINHLSSLVRIGKVNVFDLVEQSKVDLIYEAIKSVDPNSLKTIKEQCQVDVTYEEVLLVLRHYEHLNK